MLKNADSNNKRKYDELKKKNDLELFKLVQSNITVKSYCSDKYIITTKGEESASNTMHNFDVDIKATANNHGSTCIFLNTYKVVTTDTNMKSRERVLKCKQLDTSKLLFYKTNKTKQINGRYCVKYTNILEEYSRVTLWVDESLPRYILPNILLGVNITGGIVQIEFERIDDKYSGGTLTLTDLKKIKNIIPPLQENRCNEIYNINPFEKEVFF